jgi:hypothetical protein
VRVGSRRKQSKCNTKRRNMLQKVKPKPVTKGRRAKGGANGGD